MSSNEMCRYRNHSGIKVYYKVTEVQCVRGSFWFITSKGLVLFTESLHSMISAADCVIAMQPARGSGCCLGRAFWLDKTEYPPKKCLCKTQRKVNPPTHTQTCIYILGYRQRSLNPNAPPHFSPRSASH